MSTRSPATSTYQRRPEDVVASNGREVEQFATEACVARQNSGLLVPPPRIPPQMLDEAYERCDEVTGEYAKTFYLGTKLMTEAECTVHPTKCLCSNAMACSSFRRRPNQFHTKDDVFQADVRHQHAALSSDCASIRGEICYNYYGCNGSNPNKACAKANLPAWLVNSRDVIPGKNQCCGANLNCVKDANSGEARCFSNKIADIGGTHMNLGAHAVQGQQVKK